MLKYLFSFFLLIASLVPYPILAQHSNFEALSTVEYPDLQLNDVWGYSQDGKEYALVGTYDGVSIVDVTDKASPEKLHFVNAVNSVWKDIKTYDHYAYVSHGVYNGQDDSQSPLSPDGLIIIDLRTLHHEQLLVQRWHLPGVFDTAHNIYVDEESDLLYLFGVNEQGGAMILDLSQNPLEPEVIGNYNGHYLHDGYVKDQVLYGCADKNGVFVMIDVSEPDQPKAIASSETPNRTTHNAWMSESGKVLFTTDEKKSAFISSFDVSNPQDIKLLGKVRTDNYEGAIPHNAIVKNEYVFSSYYALGLRMYDAKRPDIMVEVGAYETTNVNSGQFEGAWGVYPFLPSGAVLVSDISTGLHIVLPEYQRASYVEAELKDEKGQPVFNAHLSLVDLEKAAYSDLDGQAKLGLLYEGNAVLRVEADGYEPQEQLLNLMSGEVVSLTMNLKKLADPDELKTMVTAYPNPFDELLNIEYRFEDVIADEARMSLMDLNGRELYYEDLDSNEGKIIVGKDLPSGTYMVRVYNGKRYSKLIKVIKN